MTPQCSIFTARNLASTTALSEQLGAIALRFPGILGMLATPRRALPRCGKTARGRARRQSHPQTLPRLSPPARLRRRRRGNTDRQIPVRKQSVLRLAGVEKPVNLPGGIAAGDAAQQELCRPNVANDYLSISQSASGLRSIRRWRFLVIRGIQSAQATSKRAGMDGARLHFIC
jgi:hypothetical protein